MTGKLSNADGWLACVALIGLFALVPPSLGQDISYEDWAPTQSELVPMAAAIAEVSSRLEDLWPGFWREADPFLLLSPSGGMILLMYAGQPPLGFEPLKERSGHSYRLYRRGGFLPGYQQGSFPGVYEIGDQQIYALPPMGTSILNRLEFFVHEAFHFYQRGRSGRWHRVPEDSISGVNPERYLADEGVLIDSVFLAQLEQEDRLLRSIVLESDPKSFRDLLELYLEARTERLRDRPDIEALERRYERMEGTAQYVGCRAAAAYSLATASTLEQCLTRDLHRERPRSLALRILQLRPYASGAVLSYSLDRLHIEDWRTAVAEGWRLDEIVARAVEFSTDT
jgi:hypothetical protein